MVKKIAILQSNYIPWKGYFDLINLVDEFIILDDVQYTKNDWRNRNLIKTGHGLKWLTIPVQQISLGQCIKDIEICDNKWSKKHWTSLSQAYSKAKYFHEYKEIFEYLYMETKYKYLSDVNYQFIIAINNILKIKTRIRRSTEFHSTARKTGRVLDICKQCNATEYVSGPAAKAYFDLEMAERENIKITWMDYNNYKEYSQLYSSFEHNVTVLDLLFSTGPNAMEYINPY